VRGRERGSAVSGWLRERGRERERRKYLKIVSRIGWLVEIVVDMNGLENTRTRSLSLGR
jgi:hypothetical protein